MPEDITDTGMHRLLQGFPSYKVFWPTIASMVIGSALFILGMLSSHADGGHESDVSDAEMVLIEKNFQLQVDTLAREVEENSETLQSLDSRLDSFVNEQRSVNSQIIQKLNALQQ